MKNRFGMILAEALMSVTMLATGSIIVGNVIHSTVTSTVTARNYMIAQNLATEGLEVVKNIRDTNWLMEPDDELCWLRKEPVDGEPCGVKASVGENYIVKQEDGKWMLTNSGGNVTLDHELDIESLGDTELSLYRLYINSASGQYMHIQSANPSPFYRGLAFTNIDDDTAIFRVRVQWREGAAVRKLEIIEKIRNSL